jgi:predicted alpha/beta-fold hydrolase
VVTHASKRYASLHLIGFSLGGNLTVKYLGEGRVPGNVARAVGISVPLDLHTSSLVLARTSNWLYTQRFLRSLSAKAKAKPGLAEVLDLRKLKTVRNLMEFDDHFTGPLHGFRDAVDYYTQCSAIHALPKIQIPTLILNAQNDPFLSKECFPSGTFPNITLEFPRRGGHVGFTRFDENGLYWSEMRALSFIDSAT